ncbi:MAG: formate dehydrogenase accessory sulfurtransferase FdhD, partial [Acidobacteriota bacterium]
MAPEQPAAETTQRPGRPAWNPLECKVQGEALAVIMRTPGHDVELAAGFSLTEGVVSSFAAIGTIRQCDLDDTGEANVVEVTLAPGVEFDPGRLRRNLMASAACGLCGRASLEALATQARPVASGLKVRREVLESLPGGRLRVCREDVGRHNAV